MSISKKLRNQNKRKKYKKKKGADHLQPKKTSINHCLMCHEEEEIPYDVVRDFDLMDGGDPTTPPRFNCEQCGGEMYPEYYKGMHGQEYKLSDIL
ncbi:hypothetical protein GCM10007063_15480 [Lentibacillus kapialis]|uniref:Uncharacterized protein n=1 Tax=Lentibacillus kapialis TaxID=340214 RepID=A0A917PVS2_9BACI|nr:hypothetical protein GCM10007063_15480 [Lentibacillus kapialis]